MKAYPKSFREQIEQNDCKHAYIEIRSAKFSNAQVSVFEPLSAAWDIDTCEAIARPFVKRMCELHPEWHDSGNFIYAHVSVGDASHSELRGIHLPSLWHEILGEY